MLKLYYVKIIVGTCSSLPTLADCPGAASPAIQVAATVLRAMSDTRRHDSLRSQFVMVSGRRNDLVLWRKASGHDHDIHLEDFTSAMADDTESHSRTLIEVDFFPRWDILPAYEDAISQISSE